MELFNLKGRTAAITGSSRGIGRAIAERLAEHGARVVISSRKAAACEAVAVSLNERHGPGTALAVAANLASRDDLRHLVTRTREVFGPISILICNAAGNPHMGSLQSLTEEAFRKTLDLNVLANLSLIQLIAPEMCARRDGVILIVSSVAGLLGTATIGAYGISKAADMALARNLAVELGPHNVRVNCIAPGVIRTDFSRVLWEDPSIRERMECSTPLRRFGEPDDVAGVAVCLASPAGRYITGQTIVVDGGDTVI